MIGRQCSLGRPGPRLLAVLVVGLLPGATLAENLVLRNDYRAPVVVQAASVVHGVLCRDRPYLLHYGEKTPGIVMPGNKLITVYDAQVPNRILYQGAITGGGADLFFLILPDTPPPAVRLELRRTRASEPRAVGPWGGPTDPPVGPWGP